MSEFDLIKHYFSNLGAKRPEVLLGVGDDAALLAQDEKRNLVIAVDTLVNGVHFPENTSPEDIAYKALAVNLSDLAAMGAEPAWATLALTLPAEDETWVKRFAQGFGELATHVNLQLIGGDTTRGPLTVTVQVAGYVPAQQAITRSGAQVGDKIFVSGFLGDAGLGLQIAQHKIDADAVASEYALKKLNRPQPRIELGYALRNIASAAIDISDGLAADISHILEMSQVGACIRTEQLPLSQAMKSSVEKSQATRLALSAGDDYELCFTIPEEHIHQFAHISKQLVIPCTQIGEIEAAHGLRILGADNAVVNLARYGYDHFSS